MEQVTWHLQLWVVLLVRTSFRQRRLSALTFLLREEKRVKAQFGINVTDSNKEVVDNAEVIILSVKPQFYEDVINQIKGDIKENQIVITIAPGKTLAWLAEKFGKDVKIVRTMPNTPAMVGEGMTAMCPNEHLTKKKLLM